MMAVLEDSDENSVGDDDEEDPFVKSTEVQTDDEVENQKVLMLYLEMFSYDFFNVARVLGSTIIIFIIDN